MHVSGDADYYDDVSANLASKTQAEKIGVLAKQVEARIGELLDQQNFAITREAIHRDTAESTNARVLWWSVGQMSILITLAMVQAYLIRNFFEVKLIV
jgi:hypothetical protein